MADWILIPCLVSLRAEFNKLAPTRDKASDGSIGDTAHQHESSDHNPDETGSTPYEDADNVNEVHAIDVDNDLHQPGWTMDKALQIIITRHRLGLDDRLQNVIYNRRIWSRTWGWTARAYTGPSAHTEHAHFSARYTTAQEQDTRGWGLLDQEDDMDWNDKFVSSSWAARAGSNQPTYGNAVILAAVWAKDSITATTNALTKLLAAYTAQDHVDEQALGESIAAALAPQILAGLPEGTLTAGDVEAAVRNVLRTGTGGE
jgi:hypothetical protein